MKTKFFVVAWKSYGEWRTTTYPWETRAKAQKHIDTVLYQEDRHYYNTNAQIIEIEVEA